MSTGEAQGAGAAQPLGAFRTRLVAGLKKVITGTNLWILRRSGGRLGNTFLGNPVLLLYTTGARSGLLRETPLFYLQCEETIVLVGSNGGNPRNPAWVNNVSADPRVRVKVRGREISMRAHMAEGAEYARYWCVATQAFSTWADFQGRSERRFPLVVLEPAEAEEKSGARRPAGDPAA